jgi:hypothetical protein
MYEYAGTLDAILHLPKHVDLFGNGHVVVDYKTSAKGPYPEVALQLAAYRNADFAVLADGTKVDIPEITGGAVLSIVPPDPCKLIEVDCGPGVFDVFLAIQEVYRNWFVKGGYEKRVLGRELVA